MSKGDYNQVLTWISGSLWGSSWKFFFLVMPLILLFLGLVIWKNKILDVLDLGDEIAIGLGVCVDKERKILFNKGLVPNSPEKNSFREVLTGGTILQWIEVEAVGPKNLAAEV